MNLKFDIPLGDDWNGGYNLQDIREHYLAHPPKPVTDADGQVVEMTAAKMKPGAITAYRCPKGCTLGMVSRTPYGLVFAGQAWGRWTGTLHPLDGDPLLCGCRHVFGEMPISDRHQGTVILTAKDIGLPPRYPRKR